MNFRKKRKLLSVFSLLIITSIYFLSFLAVINNKDIKPEIETDIIIKETENETELINENNDEKYSEENNIVVNPTENNIDDLYEQMSKDISQITYDYRYQKKEWFITYKEIINKYPKAMFVTIYDVFTKEELDLLFCVVQAEVGDFDFISKANVVSVILNRHYYFQENLSSVLLAENQFATIANGMYLQVEVDEETILACEYVFLFGDTTNGALYFDSTDGNSWAAHNREFIFRDSAGHDFYK